MQHQQTFQYQEVINILEKQTADFFEGVADIFAGKAESLQDGTEFLPVSLPQDLYAHQNAQTEWWYYTGHCETSNNKRFGFEFVFFKRRTDLDKFSLVPVRIFGNPIYFAHFAITDCEGKKFNYDHRKSANGLFDLPANYSENHYHLRLGDWSIREVDGTHILRATIGQDTVFEANLKPKKPVVLNGKEGNGVSYKDEGEASRYFAYTRMETEGDIFWNGKTEHFTGSSWMDREFGTWKPTNNQKGWDWFSVQLNNGCEVMCYQLRNDLNEASPFSSGTYIDAAGNYTHLTHDDFKIETTGFWKSPNSNATYPNGWKVLVPKYNLNLTISPVMQNQELDTRGTTMIVYWEGVCNVFGTENSTDGRAYVEMVGYDRSHDNPNLASFLIGNLI